jgi:H+-transporting ATPase
MQLATNKSQPVPPRSIRSIGKEPDVASISLPDTLAALHVTPETGLAHAEVDARRNKHGYNEVAEQKEHSVLKFLGKFWGLSAWMLGGVAWGRLSLRLFYGRAPGFIKAWLTSKR